jgi:hypothetical protein
VELKEDSSWESSSLNQDLQAPGGEDHAWGSVTASRPGAASPLTRQMMCTEFDKNNAWAPFSFFRVSQGLSLLYTI